MSEAVFLTPEARRYRIVELEDTIRALGVQQRDVSSKLDTLYREAASEAAER